MVFIGLARAYKKECAGARPFIISTREMGAARRSKDRHVFDPHLFLKLYPSQAKGWYTRGMPLFNCPRISGDITGTVIEFEGGRNHVTLKDVNYDAVFVFNPAAAADLRDMLREWEEWRERLSVDVTGRPAWWERRRCGQ